MDIGLEIKNFNNLIQRQISNLQCIAYLDELTGSNGYILGYLLKHKKELITQKQIEDILGITRSTASTVLSHMEKNALIERKTLLQDSRCKKIEITLKGEWIWNQIQEEINQFEKKLCMGFTDEELSCFMSYINRMKENIKEEK